MMKFISLFSFILLVCLDGATAARTTIVFIFSDDHSPNAIGAYNRWLREKRDPERPFLLRVQHKAPHRAWMPSLRHLDAYDDVLIPGPTLFADHLHQASPSRHAEMEIDRHMDLAFDLFVDLGPDYRGPAIQKRQDTSARENMKKMTPEQIEKWRAHYGPQDKAFHKANLSGEALVRWKYQRYLRSYLACIKGVDESVATVMKTLDELGLSENTVVIYASDQGFYLGDRGWYDKRWMYETSLEMPQYADDSDLASMPNEWRERMQQGGN